MKRRIAHKVLFCLALMCQMLSSVSCTDDAGGMQQQPEGRPMVQLGLHISAADMVTAADASDYVSTKERMHTLRIVVLEESGAVERNVFVEFPYEPLTEYEKVLELQRRDRKTIYLIANERSVEGLHQALNGKREGDAGFAQFMDNLTFVPDYTKPLPMTSCYTVEIGDEKYIEKKFHVVYAATKFDIVFNNNRDREVTVQSFTLSSSARSMYLMPHLSDDAGVYRLDGTGKGIKGGFDISGIGEGMYWIDWLKYVADESQANQDNMALADKRGWILEYAIPDGAGQNETQDVLKLTNGGRPFVLDRYRSTGMPTFYLPESRNMAMASAFAPGLEQEYLLDIVLTETDEGGVRTQTFRDIRLPNLRGLFRNTHVKVEINIKNNTLVLVVDLVPYTSKVLEPVFGLDV